MLRSESIHTSSMALNLLLVLLCSHQSGEVGMASFCRVDSLACRLPSMLSALEEHDFLFQLHLNDMPQDDSNEVWTCCVSTMWSFIFQDFILILCLQKYLTAVFQDWKKCLHCVLEKMHNQHFLLHCSASLRQTETQKLFSQKAVSVLHVEDSSVNVSQLFYQNRVCTETLTQKLVFNPERENRGKWRGWRHFQLHVSWFWTCGHNISFRVCVLFSGAGGSLGRCAAVVNSQDAFHQLYLHPLQVKTKQGRF